MNCPTAQPYHHHPLLKQQCRKGAHHVLQSRGGPGGEGGIISSYLSISLSAANGSAKLCQLIKSEKKGVGSLKIQCMSLLPHLCLPALGPGRGIGYSMYCCCQSRLLPAPISPPRTAMAALPPPHYTCCPPCAARSSPDGLYRALQLDLAPVGWPRPSHQHHSLFRCHNTLYGMFETAALAEDSLHQLRGSI